MTRVHALFIGGLINRSPKFIPHQYFFVYDNGISAQMVVYYMLGVKQYIEILLYCNIYYCNTIQYDQ